MKKSNKSAENDRIISVIEIGEMLQVVEQLLKNDPKNIGLMLLQNMFRDWKKRPAVDSIENKERFSFFSSVVNALVNGTIRELLAQIPWGRFFED